MQTTYHLDSAQEVGADLLDSIRATFKSKSIIITVREDDDYPELTDEMKAILDERLAEDESNYITGEESIAQLKEKYGL